MKKQRDLSRNIRDGGLVTNGSTRLEKLTSKELKWLRCKSTFEEGCRIMGSTFRHPNSLRSFDLQINGAYLASGISSPCYLSRKQWHYLIKWVETVERFDRRYKQ